MPEAEVISKEHFTHTPHLHSSIVLSVHTHHHILYTPVDHIFTWTSPTPHSYYAYYVHHHPLKPNLHLWSNALVLSRKQGILFCAARRKYVFGSLAVPAAVHTKFFHHSRVYHLGEDSSIECSSEETLTLSSLHLLYEVHAEPEFRWE